VKNACASSGDDFTVQLECGTCELIDRVADEWRELCNEGPCDQPFFRPEWFAASIRAFGKKRRVILIIVRNRTRLQSILPLWQETSWECGLPVRKLCSAGNVDHSPRFDFVHGCDPGMDKIATAVWTALKDLCEWDVIQFSNVPRGSIIEALLEIARADGFPTRQHVWARSPYITLKAQAHTGDLSQFALSRRFGYHLRHSWRRLQEQRPLCLRRVETADPSALNAFYNLEKSGWKGRKGTAIACKQETQLFYDLIAQSAARFGYLSLYFLLWGDATLAAHFALTCGGRYFPLKVAYDEDYSQYGPGHLIIGAVLQDCVTRGLTEFDCLGHWTEAKSKWTSQVRAHMSCHIFRKGLRGRAFQAKTQVSQVLTETLRDLYQSSRTTRGRSVRQMN
jgi:CelD/BcsL family acetyltransferase involved in cellulose biosynthesis